MKSINRNFEGELCCSSAQQKWKTLQTHIMMCRHDGLGPAPAVLGHGHWQKLKACRADFIISCICEGHLPLFMANARPVSLGHIAWGLQCIKRWSAPQQCIHFFFLPWFRSPRIRNYMICLERTYGICNIQLLLRDSLAATDPVWCTRLTQKQ